MRSVDEIAEATDMGQFTSHAPALPRRTILGGGAAIAASAGLPRRARAAAGPIRIGIVSENSTIDGAAIPKAAQMAVEAINKAGGVLHRPLELVVYDDHVSTSDAVRAFQRLATQDKVVAVIGSFVSEIALALMPWSARLKMPFITPGAASNQISEQVHKDYDRFKYTFHGWFTSYFIAKIVADSARDLLVDQLHMKSAAIMSEDAAWTTPLDAAFLEFLPKVGLRVTDHVRYSVGTTDFAPIFRRIETKSPDVMIIGMAHSGLVPTVQWAQHQESIPMYGVNSQATSSAFWKDTHGACEGQTCDAGAAPDSQLTPATLPFTQAYLKRYGLLPAYCGYSTFDMVHAIAEAIERVNSTTGDELVRGLEATDHVGTIGRIRFYGPKDRFTHAMEYGPDAVPGVMLQWQEAKMKTIWPLKFATTKISFPSFVKLPG